MFVVLFGFYVFIGIAWMVLVSRLLGSLVLDWSVHRLSISAIRSAISSPRPESRGARNRAHPHIYINISLD